METPTLPTGWQRLATPNGVPLWYDEGGYVLKIV